MLIVRDRRDGRPVTWGTDHDRMNAIANSDPNLVTVEDRAAYDYYWHIPRGGFGWIHPYDRDAHLHAEIKP